MQGWLARNGSSRPCISRLLQALVLPWYVENKGVSQQRNMFQTLFMQSKHGASERAVAHDGACFTHK